MIESDLIQEVRIAAQIPDSFADYPDARIRTELNHVLQSMFAPALVDARCGMLLKRQSVNMTAGTNTYPLPGRAMAAGFECLDISDGTSFWPLQEVLAHQVWQYETTTRDRPRYYAVVGSSVRFYPSPNQAYTARFQYYLRPSRLVEKQASVATGLVLGYDSATRVAVTLTMASVLNRDTGVAVTEGTRVDIIRGSPSAIGSTVQTYDASYEVVAVDMPWVNTSPGFSITLGSSGVPRDTTEIQGGDFIRAADQSEWPQLPHEYHISLAKAAASRICRDRGMYNAASALDEIVDADLRRMKNAIQPRVKSQAQPLRPNAHMLRRGRFF